MDDIDMKDRLLDKETIHYLETMKRVPAEGRRKVFLFSFGTAIVACTAFTILFFLAYSPILEAVRDTFGFIPLANILLLGLGSLGCAAMAFQTQRVVAIKLAEKETI